MQPSSQCSLPPSAGNLVDLSLHVSRDRELNICKGSHSVKGTLCNKMSESHWKPRGALDFTEVSTALPCRTEVVYTPYLTVNPFSISSSKTAPQTYLFLMSSNEIPELSLKNTSSHH